MHEGLLVAHAVSLESSHGSWKVRWDIVQPSVGQILHGKLAEPADVAYSGIVTGVAQPALRSGVTASFTLADVDSRDSLVQGLNQAVTQVAEWLAEFPTSTHVVAYLTQDFDQRDLRVTFPAHRPLRLLTAAGIAAVERSSDAASLAATAIEALGSGQDALTRSRVERLVAALG